MEIRYLGHSAFTLSEGGTTVLVDPFLSGNPKAAIGPGDAEADLVALTHGHPDHLGDTVDIAKRLGVTVVAIVELANEIAEQGVDVIDPNLGGVVEFDWGWIKLVPAWHTGRTPNGTYHQPAGLLIKMGETVVYHLGDTCLFSDLQLIARRGDHVDVAIVPIGGHWTMDRIDAVTAVEFVAPTTVIPCHYDTFPPIETDAEQFKADVETSTGANCVVLAPGETHSA